MPSRPNDKNVVWMGYLRLGLTGHSLFRRLFFFAVHECAVAALATQIGVEHRRAALSGIEAASQPRIGPEFGRSSGKLPGVTQHNSGTPMHRLHDSSNLHIAVAIPSELADRSAILRQADDGKPAAFVRRLRRADIQETCSVRKFNYIINMC